MTTIIKEVAEYLIWQSGLGWHVSRLDGRTDAHTEAAWQLLTDEGVEVAKGYFTRRGLSVEIHPLDEDLKHSVCYDTWQFYGEAYRGAA